MSFGTTISLAIAGVLAAGPAVEAPAELTIESHGTRAIVTARPLLDPAGALLTVSVDSGTRSGSWEYRNLYLDEESGAPAAEILEASRRDYLFVRAYSGGASCCWTLLVYDLAELRPVGQQLASQSPIELVRGKHGCEVGAVAVPIDRRGPTGNSRSPPALYCFDGRKFSRMATEVPAPFQAEGGSRTPPPQ
jgi:hypothetical protein